MWPFKKKNPIDEFWVWFANKGESFRDPERIHSSALDQMRDHLYKIQPGLTYELCVSNGRTTELVISADGDRNLFPKVFEVVDAAPNLVGWKITAFRQPGKIDGKIEMNGISLSPIDMWFATEPDGSRTGITLYIRGLTEENRKQILSLAFVMLDNALGEFVVETAVGFIEFAALPPSPEAAGLKPFEQIPIEVTPILRGEFRGHHGNSGDTILNFSLTCESNSISLRTWQESLVS